MIRVRIKILHCTVQLNPRGVHEVNPVALFVSTLLARTILMFSLSFDRCLHKTTDICAETNCTAGAYVSFLYLRSNKVYCSAPDFPGQLAGIGTGSSVMYLATNGIDPSVNGIPFSYYTPMKQYIKNNIIIGGTIFVAFLLIVGGLRYRKYRNKHKKLVANPGGVWVRPSINAGIQHQHETSVRKSGTAKYPLFATSCEELGVLGEGIGLYFQFLKYFARVGNAHLHCKFASFRI